ncbi:hypothetical protein [Blastopirellula marina]|uniref:Uncharacterized protein n=1 Tax=Blastopirellula marina TaxID=124 RepID=A0A2S8G922_9BACT|nr:hypothetical protein [Blastopirellula marina]PQO40917.1 hypothetical protein C5Y98_04885 [Blastopirellula marina]PTL45799.1 hypothetical protein C5Y97_04885 [Blastopirellula marina]
MCRQITDFTTWIAIVFVTLLSVSVKADEPNEEVKLSDLRKERLEVLSEAVEQAKVLYQSARALYREVWDAECILFEAKLEQCKSKQERVAVLEEYLAEAKKVEEITIQLRKDARASGRDVSLAKAERLRIEIMLQETKAGGEDTANNELRQQLFFAQQNYAIKLMELKMAEAKLKIAMAVRNTMKSHVDEAVIQQSLNEAAAKEIEVLVERNVVSPQEARKRQGELAAAESRRTTAECKVAECEAQIMFEEGCVQRAKLEAEMADVQMKLIKKKLESSK